ncbi:hypothetical protein MNBD_NITROSPINAE02-659 [hydrothermal vent metagenome]|uniref:HEPN AbiU2-like domain-containing protein n=1 Tax=hydrothermal vent metagenome TaxID=652676 RepID=A0A3B1CMW4_9ZZZZ
MLQGEFWITVNVNFLDIGVMEWRKLFGEPGGKHHWRRALSNPTKFYNDMLQTIEITNTDFEATIQKVKTYRDKFVAHLDNKSVMQIPNIEYEIKSVSYLYDYLSRHEYLRLTS